jgi:hypothetical protein
MGKKLNKNLLNEELKKFRLLSEYSFYVEEPKKDDEKLLLGSDLEEADENPDDATPPADDSNTAQNDTPAPDAGGAPDPNAAPTEPAPDQNTPPAPAPAPDPSAMPDASAPDGMDMGDTGDEVDVDVTELVQGSEEATDAANAANFKTSKLLKKFADLERRVAQMDTLSHKIDDLGKEIAKRNPTPDEKLEMRSMDSFPYNIKLSDYFKETGSNENPDGVKKAPEYILKKDDIATKFVDSSIKDTFDLPDDYEEEDVY